VKLKLLKNEPFIGDNSRGKYYLFSVADEQGVEYAYFSTEEVYQAIKAHDLKAGAVFQLVDKSNGSGKRSIEFSILGQEAPVETSADDGFAKLMLKCVQDAKFVLENSGIQFSISEIQDIATTLFIQRAHR
jgi:hypothetical protein